MKHLNRISFVKGTQNEIELNYLKQLMLRIQSKFIAYKLIERMIALQFVCVQSNDLHIERLIRS